MNARSNFSAGYKCALIIILGIVTAMMSEQYIRKKDRSMSHGEAVAIGAMNTMSELDPFADYSDFSSTPQMLKFIANVQTLYLHEQTRIPFVPNPMYHAKRKPGEPTPLPFIQPKRTMCFCDLHTLGDYMISKTERSLARISLRNAAVQ
jgi:hypothetical protein